MARRGSTSAKKGAALVTEFVLQPIEPPSDDCLWRGADGTQYDTASLAARCLNWSGGDRSPAAL